MSVSGKTRDSREAPHHLREGTGGASAGADLQAALQGHVQTADQTRRHHGSGSVQLLGDALRQARGVAGELGTQSNAETRGQGLRGAHLHVRQVETHQRAACVACT